MEVVSCMIESLGEAAKEGEAAFHACVGLTIKEDAYVQRHKVRAPETLPPLCPPHPPPSPSKPPAPHPPAQAKATGDFQIGKPLEFAERTFHLKASLSSQTLCIEIYNSKIIADVYEARACIPLIGLAALTTGGQEAIDVIILGNNDNEVVASMRGAQHAVPGFRARARLLLTRTQPGALVFALTAPQQAAQAAAHQQQQQGWEAAAAAAPAAKAMPASPAAPAAAATTTSLGAAQ